MNTFALSNMINFEYPKKGHPLYNTWILGHMQKDLSHKQFKTIMYDEYSLQFSHESIGYIPPKFRGILLLGLCYILYVKFHGLACELKDISSMLFNPKQPKPNILNVRSELKKKVHIGKQNVNNMSLTINESVYTMAENPRNPHLSQNHIANRANISLPEGSYLRNLRETTTNTESTNTIPDTKNFADILDQNFPLQLNVLDNFKPEERSSSKINTMNSYDAFKNISGDFEILDNIHINRNTGYLTPNHAYTQRVNFNYRNYLQITPETIKKRKCEYNYEESDGSKMNTDHEYEGKKQSKEKEKLVKLFMDEDTFMQFNKINRALEFDIEDEIKDIKFPFDFKKQFSINEYTSKIMDLNRPLHDLPSDIQKIWDFFANSKDNGGMEQAWNQFQFENQTEEQSLDYELQRKADEVSSDRHSSIHPIDSKMISESKDRNPLGRLDDIILNSANKNLDFLKENGYNSMYNQFTGLDLPLIEESFNDLNTKTDPFNVLISDTNIIDQPTRSYEISIRDNNVDITRNTQEGELDQHSKTFFKVINQTLSTDKSILFKDIIKQLPVEKKARAFYFALNLVKHKKIEMKQQKPQYFGDIIIIKSENAFY